ncbi:histidine decarboxylase [Sphingobacterium suaedae]|uniref:Histidine decarboxylase n=1 Tax=Sphingobacterium suaedae TaxID=1686402 RepID=A0ABW5KFJ8_9SPHI
MYTLSPFDQDKLSNYMHKAFDRAKNFIGYPIAQDFDYALLYPLLKLPLNNIGDPLLSSTYDLSSREMEKEVLAFFADLFRAPENNWWGYINNGGSEGNLYALYAARELYANGVVYYSDATHYSIQKNIKLLNMESIQIRTQSTGEIDYEDLRKMIDFNRQKPVILIANIGSTMTEAKDDITRYRRIMHELRIDNYYIHCDAALAGVYSMLLDLKPNFDFTFGADSISISGHKFIGSPLPCGLVLIKKNHKDRIGRQVAYIGTIDTTISGSRNGHTPVFLWYAMKCMGKEGFRERAVACLANAEYAMKKLQEIGIPAWRNMDAMTVVFPALRDKTLVEKWQIATGGGISHIICMPGVTKEKIDEFVADIALFEQKEMEEEELVP